MTKFRMQLFFYMGLIIVWQLLYYLSVDVFHLWKAYALPNPVGVAGTFWHLCSNGTLLGAVIYSMCRAFIGFSIAVLIGMTMGLTLVQFPKWSMVCKPLLLGVQSLPSVCWVPFAILWFGLQESAIIFVVIMGSAFSIALAVENGIRSINPVYVKAARTMGASKRTIYLKVIFPASFPAFIAGLRQGWSFAWRALMSAEVMSASMGLGYTLILGRDLADINQVMLIMILIILTGICVDRLVFSNVETRALHKRGMV